MHDPSTWLPWVVFVLGMFMVWSVVYAKSGSFRKSTLAALLVGKTFVVVYKLAGLDRTVASCSSLLLFPHCVSSTPYCF